MSSGGNRVIGPGRVVDTEAGDSAILTYQTEVPKKRIISLVTSRSNLLYRDSI